MNENIEKVVFEVRAGTGRLRTASASLALARINP